MMKKLILITVLFSCVQVESEAFTSSTAKTTIAESQSHSSLKVKRRRKKGFLWGIFKKKDCGCPKH
ncbi:hypothetical protein [Arcicella rosea]|uniref:Uncharacterized protein n=1 Tax=Arcicella rosea TaxID=502909 RepID=A0A841EN04_9BACT|nr:hypothetical protein [Arcicella rosea]MBB6001690.1 hypothetical protein [Arcicella rosea]